MYTPMNQDDIIHRIRMIMIIYQTVKCECGEYLEICNGEPVTCLICQSCFEIKPTESIPAPIESIEKHNPITFNPFSILFDITCAIIGVVSYFIWNNRLLYFKSAGDEKYKFLTSCKWIIISNTIKPLIKSLKNKFIMLKELKLNLRFL